MDPEIQRQYDEAQRVADAEQASGRERIAELKRRLALLNAHFQKFDAFVRQMDIKRARKAPPQQAQLGVSRSGRQRKPSAVLAQNAEAAAIVAREKKLVKKFKKKQLREREKA